MAEQAARQQDEDEERRRRRRLETAAALLLLLRRAEGSLRGALALPSNLMVLGATAPMVERSVRAVGERAILNIRRAARGEAASNWTSSTGLGDAWRLSGAGADRASARSAAASLSEQWRRHHADAVAEGKDALQATAHADARLRSSVERTAATEASDAYHAELMARADRAERRGYVVVEVWNALLDACERCWDLDGQRRTRPDGFDEYPPLHPRCRCGVDVELE